MNSLVGYTGFVGSNISETAKFDGLYNSKNIEQAFGTKPEVLIYSGVRAEKYLANEDPNKDYMVIEQAISNIKKIRPKTIVLISTIDVYKTPIDVDEDTVIDTKNLNAYGLNRFYLEKWVEENIDSHLIIHLPGLYGKNIKKNFIYDMINLIPTMLTETKFDELRKKDSFISDYYIKQENGFLKCKKLIGKEQEKLRTYFTDIGFTALNFSDSRATYQFYNLSFLWNHIKFSLINGIEKLNLSTQPISTGELYKYIKKNNFVNELTNSPAKYNYKTKYSDMFGGKDGYIFDKRFVLEDIKKFVEGFKI